MAVKPEKMDLYPTMGSLKEVIELADSKVPIEKKNEMFSLLMTFQNTLIKLLGESDASK